MTAKPSASKNSTASDPIKPLLPVTSAVTAELLRSCDQVVLNVRADNPPAINAYRRLGFAEHAQFEERLIHRLGPPWADITAPLRRLFTRKETDRR